MERAGWITSQFDTAPKHHVNVREALSGWITSQFDTAPKHSGIPPRHRPVGLPVSSTLLQNWLGEQNDG